MSYFQGYLGGCSQLTHIFLYYSGVNSYIIFLYYLYYSAWRCLVPSFHQARRWHHQSQQRCYTAPLQRCKEGPCSQRCSHFTILPSFQYWHPPNFSYFFRGYHTTNYPRPTFSIEFSMGTHCILRHFPTTAAKKSEVDPTVPLSFVEMGSNPLAVSLNGRISYSCWS